MTFPNAFQGMKNVFTAQILSLIATGCTLFGSITGGFGVIAGSAVTGLGGGVIIFGGLVLMLLSLIFNLAGLSRASRDEEAFKGAFYCALISLILSVILNIIMAFGIGGSVLRGIYTIISRILGILVIAYVFKGIDRLAGKLGQADVAAAGHRVLVFLWVVYAVTIFCNLMGILFPSAGGVMAALSVISFLVEIGMIVGYILYLVHLNRAKQMLQQL